MQDRIRLVLIYGSVREERFCDQVVAWAREQIEQRSEFELSLVDPAVMFRQPGEAQAVAEQRHVAECRRWSTERMDGLIFSSIVEIDSEAQHGLVFF